MKKISTIFLLLSCAILNAQNNSNLMPYKQVIEKSLSLDERSDCINVNVIGKSVGGREIIAIEYSTGVFCNNEDKLKVLIFAQQHGNEQSGKEGLMRVAKELAESKYSYLLKYMDIAIIPQINPDGSERNERRNSNGADLNRGHLLLLEPELVALHKFYDKYQFDVTIDLHEYFPYGDAWKKFGYRRNSDILIGLLSNPLISKSIKTLQQECFRYISPILSSNNIKNGLYTPGSIPGDGYYRYSTYDINDGRQSFGIQGAFSFIQEGLNGTDSFSQNISHRIYSQEQSILAILDFLTLKKNKIKDVVRQSREDIINRDNVLIPLQLEHVADGSALKLPVTSYKTGNDSIIVIADFRPIVKVKYSVKKAIGYLIPQSDTLLMKWVENCNFVKNSTMPINAVYCRFFIKDIIDHDFEGDNIVMPVVETISSNNLTNISDYIFVSAAQIKSNLLIIGLEPLSEMGLYTYNKFSYLIKKNSFYPIIRVQ